MDQVLAIDVGGTKVSCGVVSAEGTILKQSHIPTDHSVSGEELYSQVLDLVSTLAPFEVYGACGIGSAGPMEARGETISPINIRAWNEFPLASRLEADIGLPTNLVNDVQALALGEGWVGAAAGMSNFMAMVVSTGVGGGLVLDGRLLDGNQGNAGHIGHVIVANPGRDNSAHKEISHLIRGSLEAETSGTAIAAYSGKPAEEATPEIVAEVGRSIGQAVGSVINLLDLETVVVAGGVALGFGEPFFRHAQTELDRICQMKFSRGVKIKPAGCGADGPLIGAGAVGFRHLGEFPGGIK